MRKALITGITGFVGSHLAESLKGSYEVWGVGLDGNGPAGARVFRCDLLDCGKVREIIAEARPDVVFHLAAQSEPALSFKYPADTLRNNIFSTLNIFEAIVETSPEAVVINVCSGDEYGDVLPDSLPVKEITELRPTNPYAVSKATADLLGFQYWKARGLKVVRCRPFNHFGPGQSDQFVTASFARQIAEIEAGVRGEKTLKVGNLEAAKDFLYVKDVVRAYEVLAEKGAYGEAYNICSGRLTKIGDIAEALVSLSSEKIEILTDPERWRPADTAAIYGDGSKLKSLGWEALFSLEEGLKELLDYWRKRVRAA